MTRHIGIDLGGTNIKWAVLDDGPAGPEVVQHGEVPTLADAGPLAVIDRVADAGEQALSAAGSAATAGVGMPGLFDAAAGTTRFLPNLPGDWAGAPLGGTVSERLGLPVRLINDARAFTLAEHLAGAGRGCSTMVGVPIGTGIGGGLIVDGRLHLGIDGTAGEFGHQTIDPDGPVCGCGMRGCVEALAKASVLAERAGQPSAKAAAEAARTGDRRALDAFEAVGAALAVAVANSIVLLSPDRVVIGGGVAQSGELLLEPVRRHVRARVTVVPVERVEILTGELGPIAGAVGAALWGAGRGS